MHGQPDEKRRPVLIAFELGRWRTIRLRLLGNGRGFPLPPFTRADRVHHNSPLDKKKDPPRDSVPCGRGPAGLPHATLSIFCGTVKYRQRLALIGQAIRHARLSHRARSGNRASFRGSPCSGGECADDPLAALPAAVTNGSRARSGEGSSLR